MPRQDKELKIDYGQSGLNLKQDSIPEPEEKRGPYALIIILCIVLVTGLSLFVFSGQSLRLDESQSLWQSSRDPGGILYLVAQDVHVPLYHILLHYWEVLWGNRVETARMFSLLFFILTIPATYLLGKLAYGRRVGIFASVLIAISPFLNWYGNEIRMYSLLTFITVINQYFFLSILKKRKNWPWFFYGLTVLIGAFSHYFFFFVLITQAFFFLFKWRIFPKNSLLKFIIIVGILLIAFIPWGVYVWKLGFTSNTQPSINEPSSINIFNTFSEFLFGFQDDHINTIIVSLWPLTMLLGFLVLQENKKISPETFYFFLAAGLPILSAFTFSLTIKPFFLARYLILSVPALYIFLSWVFSTYPPRFSIVMRTLLIAAMLFGTFSQITNADISVKENYHEVSDYLAERASFRDIIVVSAPFTIYPVEYYYSGPSAIITLPVWNRFRFGPIPSFSEDGLVADVDKIVKDHQTVWVVLSFDQGYEEKIRIYFDTHFERIDQKNFSPGLDLYAYKLKY